MHQHTTAILFASALQLVGRIKRIYRKHCTRDRDSDYSTMKEAVFVSADKLLECRYPEDVTENKT